MNEPILLLEIIQHVWSPITHICIVIHKLVAPKLNRMRFLMGVTKYCRKLHAHLESQWFLYISCSVSSLMKLSHFTPAELDIVPPISCNTSSRSERMRHPRRGFRFDNYA